MHFFNPVPLMALVEVVPGLLTAIEVVDAVALLARRLGKTPVVAADTPGFIVNRVQRAFYLEAYRILEEGAAEIEAIDDAMRGIGFRLGLFELADVVGTDVNLAAGIAIFEGFFDDPRYRPAQVQRRDAGRLGRKAEAGYYDYGAEGARGSSWPVLARSGRVAASTPRRSRRASWRPSSTRPPRRSRTASRPRRRSTPPCGWGRTGPTDPRLGRANRPAVSGSRSTRSMRPCRTAVIGSSRSCARWPTAGPSSRIRADRVPLTGRYRAVIFDMDGLLLDTETLWHEAEVELFARHGATFTWDDKMAVIGTSYDFTARYFAERLGQPPEEGDALVDEMVELMHERVRRQRGPPGRVSWSTACAGWTGCGSAWPRTRRASSSTTRWRPPG